MDWVPYKECLLEVLEFLRESHAPFPSCQNLKKLKYFANLWCDFGNYLIHIFLCQSEDLNIRVLSGLILKNYLKEMKRPTADYVKKGCLTAIIDPVIKIRSVGSLIISTIVYKEPACNEYVKTLCSLCTSQDFNTFDGAFGALHRILEDCCCVLSVEINTQISTALLPKCFELLKNADPKLQITAINCTNQIFHVKHDLLSNNIELYIDHLFIACTDLDAEVRKTIFKSFSTLMKTQLKVLSPYLDRIFDYTLLNLQNYNIEVALEACEFCLSFISHPTTKQIVEDRLHLLLPVLLRNMGYSTIDLHKLKLNGSGDKKDDDDDVKSTIPRALDHYFSDCKSNDDTDDDADELVSDWNLRKCSANTLDDLSIIFQDKLLSICLQEIKKMLFSDDWITRESALLALGAISSSNMFSHMEEFMPFLLFCLKDNMPLIRSITCWTISRYPIFILLNADVFLIPALDGLLDKILDCNKLVQKAACSAFSVIVKKAGVKLSPYLNTIVPKLVKAFDKYQTKNLCILYDTLSTLTTAVGYNLNQPNLIKLIMPPLVMKWNYLDNDDRRLFPLFNCLSTVATALQMNFLPYSEPVFTRCILLIEENLYSDDGEIDFVTVSLHLLGSLIEAIREQIRPLVEGYPFSNILNLCMQHTENSVRQAAFTLLGEITKSCYDQIYPRINDIIVVIEKNLHPNPDYNSVTNNAIWALGEILMRLNPTESYCTNIVLAPMIQIIKSQSTIENRTILYNTAVTLGRMSLLCPYQVAPSFDDMLKPWCFILRNFKDNQNKDIAFRGLCQLTYINPKPVSDDFVIFCDAIASWDNPQEALKNMIIEILQNFEHLFGKDTWKTFWSTCPKELRNKVVSLYSIDI